MSASLADEGLVIPDAPTEPGEFEHSLRSLRDSGRKLLVAYVTGGLHDEWPDVVRAVADAGADAIEIGIPFSDPVMDGPIIQEASELALRDGASPVTVLDTLRTIDAGVPLAVMTYYNLAFHMGHERFASSLYEAGVRAAILPDLPLEEVGPWARAADPAGIETVMLAAPTAPDERLPRVVARSRGFVYAVGLLGVTGERDALAASSLVIARRLKAITDKPVLVGVGVSNAQQAAEVSQVADGCVIGSALMRRVVAGEGPAGAGAFIAEVRRSRRVMSQDGAENERRKIPLEQPLYDRVDPEFFTRLVDHFYDAVLVDPVLAPLYPTEDLDGARERLRLFLTQFWGGPQTYSDQRGHPRLRMRHAPFVIGEVQREAWFRLMANAVGAEVEAGALSEQDEAAMLGYFDHSARFMMNVEQ